jgi:hypothetical protein
MKSVPFLSLGAVLTAAALFAACGKATQGTCEEANDCADLSDGAPPAKGNDGSSEHDASDDVTVSSGDDEGGGQSGDSGDAGDANIISPGDAAVCPGQKLCNGSCVGVDDPAYGCTPTSCSACAIPNSTNGCSNGACSVATCNSGYADCAGTGLACTNLDTTSNCGKCGAICGAAAPLCTEGDAGTLECTLTCPTTPSTEANCSGSCVDLATNSLNCGVCGKACASPADATATCSSKVCGFTCNTGYQLCNGACIAPDPAAVFVSPSSITTGCGTIGAPCGTIAAGIAYATLNNKTHIYIDHGTYPEQVTLSNGINIEGGWTYGGNGSWAKECTAGANALAIISPASAPSAVVAHGVMATLSTLTVRNEATAAASESLYGVLVSPNGATAANLTMNDVVVSVTGGGAGAAGATSAAPTGPTQVCTAASDGNPAPTAGPNGSPSAAGYASSGYAVGNGANGTSGPSGDNGTMAGTGACVTPTNSACSADATACVAASTPTCGTNGSLGCGGPGGAAGTGGKGGGSSIGLFVWGSTVTVSAGSLTAGNGGAGGAGGSSTSAPTSWSFMDGAAGKGAPYYACALSQKCVGSPPVDCNPFCRPGTATLEGSAAAGTAGGNGGQGAAGGSGASGAGGDSWGYYVGGGGTVTGTFPTPVAGTAGTSPGPVAGAAGKAGPHN